MTPARRRDDDRSARRAPLHLPRPSGGFRRGGLLLAIAGAVVALDQWTKSWAQQSLANGSRHVVGPIYLVLTFNRGAAFSLGTGASPVIEMVAVLLAVVVLWWSGRLARSGARFSAIVGFGLLSGGAVSNLVDRLARHHHGGVVDFIQLVSWWPVFNLADAAVTVGAVVIGITLVFFVPPRRTVVDRGSSRSSRTVRGGPGEAGNVPGAGSVPGGGSEPR